MQVTDPRILVVDFGGQYAHLIASRIRRLGALSEIVAVEDALEASRLPGVRGLVYSGGPASVYEEGAPRTPEELLTSGLPVLGICYGLQLIALQLGAEVHRSEIREYGAAMLSVLDCTGIFQGAAGSSRVWMSHGDSLASLPPGFVALGRTEDCPYAAIGHVQKKIYGLQFHPEVMGTDQGDLYLENFISLCGLAKSWKMDDYLERTIRELRDKYAEQRVFMLISGGVDSTVAFALLSRALPALHLRGLLIDTGFMRASEIENVVASFHELGIDLRVAHAARDFFSRLADVTDPEEKRTIIGREFLAVRERELEKMELNVQDWFLGQGTIYPDTIESGGTRHSHKIKTHHNRVDVVTEMIAAGRVVEPLRDLYKDEVRQVGRLLGLPEELIMRHPFPGPGLAIRCLCSAGEGEMAKEYPSGWEGLSTFVLPVKSVGVQGDARSYAHPLLLRTTGEFQLSDLCQKALRYCNENPLVNRVLLTLAERHSGVLPRLRRAFLTPERIEVLRRADRIVYEFLKENGLYAQIWQCPVVLCPLSQGHGEALILRPVVSLDAMTASPFLMDASHRLAIAAKLMTDANIDLVLYDLTGKPPGTIEWE
ncbi:MAG: glutamine-hydrolyzing GMP synthase [Spirochaetales bacterium]|nr:glutamine-hydrolyzing GMP synthase [Spirochaetales bacterium]